MSNFEPNLYRSEWIDLVFKNRNQNYGAYILRSESASITTKALLITVPIFIALFASPMIYNKLMPEITAPVEIYHPVEITEVPVVVKPEEKKVEQIPAEPELKKVKMVKLTANVAVVNEPADEPPMLNDLKDAVIGQINQVGAATQAVVTPSTSEGTGTGVSVPEVDDAIYDSNGIERFPEFQGGMSAWAKFIQRNLHYPYQAQENGVQGKVFISFVVEKDGSITDVKLIKGIGSGCDEEAIRVIKSSPKWIPGQQNSRAVRVRYTMPLGFQLAQ